MKKITFLMYVLIMSVTSSYSQKLVEKNYFQANPQLGGEVTINESIKETIGDKTYTRFVVNTERAGNYVMNLWMMATELPGGAYSSYDVLVNGIKIDGRIAPTRGDWQSIGLTAGKVPLKAGKNTISFVGKAPEIPEIEFIRLSSSRSLATISSTKYDQYKAEIKKEVAAMVAESAPANAPASAPAYPPDGTIGDIPILVLKDTMEISYEFPTWQHPQYTNPEGNYVYKLDFPVKYTYYRTVSLTAGQKFFVATEGGNNFGHILEVFSSAKSQQYSWVNKSNKNCLASINITVPESGTYYVRVRSSKNGASGTTNLNINGQNYYSNIPLYSAGIRVTMENGTPYNVFTCYSTSDSRIWIEEGEGSATPGKITAYNDDYQGGNGTFNWGRNSRIKTIFPRTVHAVQVTAFSASTPVGKCDLYAKCRNSAIYPYFEKLIKHSDDAIQSAPISNKYNAFAWAGGITQRNEWPDEETSRYWVPNNPLASFDKYFLYVRYNKCGIFSRDGATEANSVINLYGILKPNGTVEYTSASITKGADNHPHGYAWETKVGKNMRTFHPQYALEGKEYGKVLQRYTRIGTGLTYYHYTLAEAIADGVAVIEQVKFTDFEKSIITAQKEVMSNSEINNFINKYNTWKKACDNISSSSATACRSLPEYTTLINYCNSLPGSEYLVYEQLGNDEDLAVLLLKDITLAGSISNRQTLSNIKTENERLKSTPEGATIVRFPYTNAMKLVKSILSNSPLLAPSSIPTNMETNGMSYSNSDNFFVISKNKNVYITFTLPEKAKIALSILDLNASPVSTLLSNVFLNEGEYNYSANLSTGTYLVELFINGNYNVKKVIIK